MVYVCYNNEAFMNTGGQASTATPYGTYTTTTTKGKLRNRKQITKIMVAHGIKYAATACVSYPFDYMRKLQKAKEIKGPAFIDLLTPCVPGWGYNESQTINVGKLSVDTGFWPLYEVVNGKFSLTYKPKKLEPVKKLFKLQGRFHHLKAKELNMIQAKLNREWNLMKQGKYWETIEY